MKVRTKAGMRVNERNVSPVYLANYYAYNDPRYKIICNQGGARSGKTYSILQNLTTISEQEDLEISVVSKTLPHIKKGALKDFQNIRKAWDIYNDNLFNKTDLIYKYNNDSYFEFFSADKSDKLRGPGRDVLYINEVNNLSYMEYKELAMRTRGKIFIDYNPVDEYHWIYDKIIPRKDCKFIQSNIFDNWDFLPDSQREEILNLKDEDLNLWKIYGLGERAKATNIIYDKFRISNERSEGQTIYGLDFGFNNPTALIKVQHPNGNKLYVQVLLYESHLTNAELIEKLKLLIPNRNDYIYADSASPDKIEEISKAGFNIFPADKSVSSGLDFCKRFEQIITPDSLEYIKEIKSYKYKTDRNGIVLEEPIKFNDHLMDAFRYCVFTYGRGRWLSSNDRIFIPKTVTSKGSRFSQKKKISNF